jgi:hypothetical protein
MNKIILLSIILLTGCAGWNDPPPPPRELTAYEKQKQLDGQKCAYEANLATANDRIGLSALPLIQQCMRLKGYDS